MTVQAAFPVIRIASKTDLIAAAERLQDVVWALTKLRVSAVDNIASDRFLHDEEGNQINDCVFGWSSAEERWWAIKGVTFFSPTTVGARYECEPFWCNRDGFFTRNPNSALLSIDSSKIS